MNRAALSRRVLWFFPALALLLIFRRAAWDRFRLPLTPWTDPDLNAYLTPSLDQRLGEGFQHLYGQCYLYPWLLGVVVRLGGDYRAVTLVQHTLGLGTGALLFGCWMRLRAFVPEARVPGFVFGLMGAAMAGLYLLCADSIAFEHTIRPDAVFPFFVLLNIFCNLGFVRDRFLLPRPRGVLLNGVLAAVFSLVAWLIKPSFGVALVFANLPVVISLFRPGASRRGKALLLGVPLLAAVVLLVPEWALRRHDPQGELYLARSLFSIHANLIDDQMAEDLASHEASAYPVDRVAAAHDELSKDLQEIRQNGSKYWPALGFNPDMVLNRKGQPTFAKWLHHHLGGRDEELAFYRYYYARTWTHHPEWMVGKVLRQLHVFYTFDTCPAFFTTVRQDVGETYQQSAVALLAEPKLLREPAGKALVARTDESKDVHLRVGPYPVTAAITLWLGSGYFVGCLWAMAVGAGVWWVPRWRGTFGNAAAALLLLYAYNFGTVLTLAIGHTLDVGRYSRYQLAYTLLPLFGSIWLALEALAATVRTLRDGKPAGQKTVPAYEEDWSI